MSMENYFAAKKKLFDHLKKDCVAITNVDDPYGLKMVADCPCRVVTYGIDHPADYQVIKYQLLADKTIMTLQCNGETYEIESNLVARFNIYNLLAAVTALNVKGIAIADMVITGDVTQIDLDHGHRSGLIDAAETLKGIDEIRILELSSDDVVRHPLVQKIIERYEERSDAQKNRLHPQNKDR